MTFPRLNRIAKTYLRFQINLSFFCLDHSSYIILKFRTFALFSRIQYMEVHVYLFQCEFKLSVIADSHFQSSVPTFKRRKLKGKIIVIDPMERDK